MINIFLWYLGAFYNASSNFTSFLSFKCVFFVWLKAAPFSLGAYSWLCLGIISERTQGMQGQGFRVDQMAACKANALTFILSLWPLNLLLFPVLEVMICCFHFIFLSFKKKINRIKEANSSALLKQLISLLNAWFWCWHSDFTSLSGIQNFRFYSKKGYRQIASCQILEVRYNYYIWDALFWLHTTCQIAKQMF